MAVDCTMPTPRLPRVPGAIRVGERARWALNAGYPLTVIRAARGFGKTSVLVSWLRAARDGIRSIYVALNERAGSEEGFWATLAEALDVAGVATDDELLPRERVVAAIEQLETPLRLVLDDFHHAAGRGGAASIDDDLVDLVRNHDGFYLVVAGRLPRMLETAGSISVGTAVLGPEDLKFTADDVVALANDIGVQLKESCAEQIVADLGGWPGAIRAGLTNTDPENVVDERRVAGYLEAVLNDHGSGELRDFALRTAVPADFDSDLAMILTGQQPGAMLRLLRNSGFLRVVRDRNGARFSYYPAIRRALRQLAKETRPELKKQVYEALMSTAAEAQNPALVLHHAARAQRWDTAVAVVERNWMQLLTTDPQVLLRTADGAPTRVVQDDPRLQVVRKHRAVLADPERSPRTPWPVEDDPGLAAVLADWLMAERESADGEGLALVLWGVANLRGGNPDAAIYAFNRARVRGHGAGDPALMTLGGVCLALAHALNGEPELAHQMLREPDVRIALEPQPAAGSAGTMLSIAATVARALIAVDRADPAAGEAVRDMVTTHERNDLWAMGVFARAQHAAHGETPEEVFRQANQVRAALRQAVPGSLAQAVLRSALVELLIAGGMAGVASGIEFRLDHAVEWTARAKAYLARNRFSQAITSARHAVEAPRVSLRSLVEAHVILAAAYHGSDQLPEARVVFSRAVALAHATGQRRPFYLMPRAVFDLLGGADPALQRLWPASGPDPATTGAAPLPTLTMREAEVLRALEQHDGPVGIAGALGVSVNTAKTHLRSVYRKLGVGSRNEALAVLGREPNRPGAGH